MMQTYRNDGQDGRPDPAVVLSRAQTYPGTIQSVEAIQTHLSWVFLADGYAYKLKKPLRLDFVDFSTAQARKFYCEEELRLNRRLAPDVYLAVVALREDAVGRLTLGEVGEPVEWLVKMRRLPRERMLDSAIALRSVRNEDIDSVAATLARFYRSLEPIEMSSAAYRERLALDIASHAQALEDPAYVLPAPQVRRVAHELLAFVDRAADVFERRLSAGCIVEGHGDLRPEHVCLLAQPVVIDCLEFRRDFRVLDLADELAYLALECERLGSASTGEALVTACLRTLADKVPPELLHFYGGYRALIRATIAAWHINDAPAADIGRWIGRACDYLRLAEIHTGACG